MEDERNRTRQVEPAQSALGRCLVEGDAATNSRNRRRRREALGISLAIESVVLALLIVVPMMTSVAQPKLARILAPLPIVMGDWNTHSAPQRFSPRPAHHQLSFPVRGFPTPVPIAATNSRPDSVPDGDPSSVIPDGYVPGGIPMSGPSIPHSPVEPPSVDIRKRSEERIVKVSGSVQQAQLILRIEPRYPPLAVQTRKEGTVLLHAVISVDGRITALEVVSGPPLLVQAAVDAVRQWRYRPTYLNGEPVEVETSITVIFRLGQ